jgi:hypothetical protein
MKINLPFIPSHQGRGEIKKSLRSLWERVRVRGIYGLMKNAEIRCPMNATRGYF